LPMATATMQPIIQDPSELDRPAEQIAISAVETQSSEGGVWRGDSIAFKIWIVGFLAMMLMNLYDLIAGLFR